MPIQLDPTSVEKAIQEYQNGKSMKNAANDNGLHKGTFHRILRRRGIEIFKKPNEHKYEFNEDFFQYLSDERSCYWTGFIGADGCICSGSNGTTRGNRDSYILQIGLSSKDEKHLQKFVQDIGAPEEIVKTYTGSDGYSKSRINICSIKLIDDLKKHGIEARKSLTHKFPATLNDEQLRHYIRGYFDGDGSISTNGKKRNGQPKYAVNVIGSKDFMEGFMSYMEKILGLSPIKLQQRNEAYIWNKTGDLQVKKFLDYLYKDATIYLDRKYNRYLEFCRPESTVA